MPYRPYRSDRRHRRRRWLLIVLTAIAVITVIAYLVSRDTEKRSAGEFFAAADQATDLHREASADLEGALASIGVTSKPELEARLTRIVTMATSADELLDVDPPVTASASYATMSTASAAWLAGVTGLRTELVGLMNNGADDEAVARIRSAVQLLGVGDVAYAQFLESVEDSRVEGLGAVTFEPVIYVNREAQDPLLYDPLNLALRINSSYELAPRHDVGVVGQTEPEPVGDRGGVPLVPFSEAFGVTAIVTNNGNEVESALSVELEVLNAGTSESSTLKLSIDQIDPGASASITFFDVQIDPGTLYQLKLTVTIPEDGKPDNNTWVMIRTEES